MSKSTATILSKMRGLLLCSLVVVAANIGISYASGSTNQRAALATPAPSVPRPKAALATPAPSVPRPKAALATPAPSVPRP